MGCSDVSLASIFPFPGSVDPFGRGHILCRGFLFGVCDEVCRSTLIWQIVVLRRYTQFVQKPVSALSTCRLKVLSIDPFGTDLHQIQWSQNRWLLSIVIGPLYFTTLNICRYFIQFSIEPISRSLANPCSLPILGQFNCLLTLVRRLDDVVISGSTAITLGSVCFKLQVHLSFTEASFCCAVCTFGNLLPCIRGSIL